MKRINSMKTEELEFISETIFYKVIHFSCFWNYA